MSATFERTIGGRTRIAFELSTIRWPSTIAAVIMRKRDTMIYAIIRGKNGRRREADFGDSAVRVDVYASETTVDIFVEADVETLPDRALSYSWGIAQ
jgi:hypothetical protein